MHDAFLNVKKINRKKLKHGITKLYYSMLHVVLRIKADAETERPISQNYFNVYLSKQ